jgi:hypothetical protein
VLVVALALAVFALGLFWTAKNKKQHVTKREFKTTDELIQWLAGEAGTDASRENYITLDYSVNSIKSVSGRETIKRPARNHTPCNGSRVVISDGLVLQKDCRWARGQSVGQVCSAERESGQKTPNELSKVSSLS